VHLRDYELVVIFKPSVEDQTLEQEIEKVSGLVGEGGGQVMEVNRWGKKPLGYDIQGERNGTYVLFRFRSEPSVLLDMRKHLQLDEHVLRHRMLLSQTSKGGSEEVAEAADEVPAEEP